MPNFFVPFTKTPQEAESVYQEFLKSSSTYPLTYPNARLFRITFQHSDTSCVAEVGKELDNWPDEHGRVLAIVETTDLITIHTQRSVLRGDRILLSPSKASGLVYFDDYQPADK